jgi:hypothetical protein
LFCCSSFYSSSGFVRSQSQQWFWGCSRPVGGLECGFLKLGGVLEWCAHFTNFFWACFLSPEKHIFWGVESQSLWSTKN